MNNPTAQHHPCPNCGHEMEFSAQAGQLFCQHCQQAFEQPTREITNVIVEKNYEQQLAELEEQAETTEQIITRCNNCGAEIVLPQNIVADRCRYCDSPIVASGKSQRQIRPTALLPFKISKKQADTSFQKWLNSRWFMPSAVYHEAKTKSFHGVYLPYWTYDCETLSEYTGQRGEYYYVTVYYHVQVNGRSQRRSRSERRTRWYPAAGLVRNNFDDLLIAANDNFPDELQNALTPWHLAELTTYHPDFIRGFQEQSYSIPLSDGFETAKLQMRPEIEDTIRADIGGDTQRIQQTAIDYRKIRFKLILLPLWVNSFSFHNKTYQFLVNAQTGEVQGKRPWSIAKITTVILLSLLAASAILFYFLKY